MSSFSVERLDHLGIVAGVCQEIGLVEYFDRLDEQVHARVSVGQAVLAMVLNGLAHIPQVPPTIGCQGLKKEREAATVSKTGEDR